MVVNPLYTIKKRIMMYRVDGGARAMDDQVECLEDQILADVFGLESGVTTKGSCSLILYYDPINSISRNTQPLYICYFDPIDYLVPIYPRSCRNMTTIAFHLNYITGL